MLFMGVALALGLLIGVQLSQGARSNKPDSGAIKAVTQEDLNQTVQPVLFKFISEQNGELRLSGTSEPNSVIVIQNNNENFRQIKSNSDGKWLTSLDVKTDDTLEIGLLVFIKEGAKIRSEEILYRIPAPDAVVNFDLDEALSVTPALIMVTAPGGPTRIIQSPFRGLPTSGPLSMGPIDYDERGSVIFSGTSKAAGNVSIYANDIMVGQSSVAVNGRWFVIAAETLPLGSYDIKTELTEANGNVSLINVPFKRLKGFERAPADQASVVVSYEPHRWQVGRNLYGGGHQYTAIFAMLTPDRRENDPAD